MIFIVAVLILLGSLFQIPQLYMILYLIPFLIFILNYLATFLFYLLVKPDASEVLEHHASVFPFFLWRSMVRAGNLFMIVPHHWRLGYFYQNRNISIKYIRLKGVPMKLYFGIACGTSMDLENEKMLGLTDQSIKLTLISMTIIFILMILGFDQNSRIVQLEKDLPFQENICKKIEAVFSLKPAHYSGLTEFLNNPTSSDIAHVLIDPVYIIKNGDHYILTDASSSLSLQLHQSLSEIEKRFDALRKLDGTYSQFSRESFWKSVTILSDNPHYLKAKQMLTETSVQVDIATKKKLEGEDDTSYIMILLPLIEAKNEYLTPLKDWEITEASKRIQIQNLIPDGKSVSISPLIEQFREISYAVPQNNSFSYRQMFQDYSGKILDQIALPTEFIPVKLSGILIDNGLFWIDSEKGSVYLDSYIRISRITALSLLSKYRFIKKQIDLYRIRQLFIPAQIFIYILIILASFLYNRYLYPGLNHYEYKPKTVIKGSKTGAILDGALTLSSENEGNLSVLDQEKNGRLSSLSDE